MSMEHTRGQSRQLEYMNRLWCSSIVEVVEDCLLGSDWADCTGTHLAASEQVGRCCASFPAS